MGVWWWRLLFPALAGILLSPEHCASQKAPRFTFMHDATSAQDISYYDYIIIGGGTAGCPLAATLSQNYSILLLERGGSPYGNPNITNLAAFGDVFSDTSPTSPSQRFISQDGVTNTRARVLGGGSCFNAGFYTRASPRYVREAGWDGKAVNESYKWVEKVVAFEPKVRQWQSAFRDGLLEVGVGPNNGFTYDHINGTKVGGTTFDQHGYRHFAADLLEYANPTGITVLLHATVNRILFRTKGVSRPSAYGVEFIDSSGRKHTAYLKHGPRNEIIVSAGALGSPQLLMLSGVGPAHHLQAHNISITLDQPLVGQGMADNPMNAIFVPSPIPVEVSLIQVVGITNFGSYIEASSGKNFVGGSLKDFEMLCPKDPKSIESMETLEDAAFRGGFILEKIEDPKSTGHLELRTRDPNENPVVTFNYFQDPRDLERCVEGISTVEKVIESKAFSPFRYKNMSVPVLLNLTASSLSPKDTNATLSLEQFCRDTVLTIWHYHGGCQVGRVVDRDYKVLGVDALRVIDGSTFNHSPGTNPQATVMMLGRYMGVKILTERLAAPASDSSDNGNIVQENK